jgi:hypothetical protein
MKSLVLRVLGTCLLASVALGVIGSLKRCIVPDDEQVLEDKIAVFDHACEQEDFETAYSLLPDIKTAANNTNNSSTYDKCKMKVVKREALYLVAQDNEQSAKRLMVLLSQYLDKDERRDLVKELYNLAEKIENQYVIDLLIDEIEE